MPLDLAVQIVNYRTKPHLASCLASVVADLDGSAFDHRVLVLDNGSGDDLTDLEGEFAGTVEFLSSPDNLGFGGGHNRLARETDATFVCCVNPDVLIDEPAVFARLLGAFDDQRVAAVGPLLRTESRAPQVWDHGELHGLRAWVANGAGHAHWEPRTERTDVAWVSGAFTVFRRTAFDGVGGFDERFFLYKEEEDLCLQLRRHGWRIVYDPDVSVVHVGSVVARREDHLQTSIDRYVAKNYPGPRRRALDLLYRHVTRRL
jgi:N-acetylglucosaminyl-diphospho-decaprenol L-rhamnosyltransferase